MNFEEFWKEYEKLKKRTERINKVYKKSQIIIGLRIKKWKK